MNAKVLEMRRLSKQTVQCMLDVGELVQDIHILPKDPDNVDVTIRFTLDGIRYETVLVGLEVDLAVAEHATLTSLVVCSLRDDRDYYEIDEEE